MEATTEELKNLYICTSIKHDFNSPEEVSDQATRLISCFANLPPVGKFYDLLSNRLSEFALKCDCVIVAKVLDKILKINQSPTSLFSMWQHLSSPIAAFCSRPQSEKEADIVLETLAAFWESEWTLLVAQGYLKVYPLGQPVYRARWSDFLDIVRALMPLRDTSSIAMFLSHSPPSKSRDEALKKLAEISGKPDLIAIASRALIR
jgi:hypothetical protein